MEWNNDAIFKLIDAYRDNPVLWDPLDKNYKILHRKNEAWESIASLFGTDVLEVKKKMNSLLASYRRERQKITIKQLTGGSEDSYHPSWFAFDSLSFLFGKYRPRKRVTAIEMIREDDEKDSYVLDSESEIDVEEDAATAITEEKFDLSASGSSWNGNSVPVIVKKPSLKRKRQLLEPPPVNEVYDILRRDECGTYGEHVANKLRKLDDRNRAIAQHNINNILFEAEMKMYFPEAVSQPLPNVPFLTPKSKHIRSQSRSSSPVSSPQSPVIIKKLALYTLFMVYAHAYSRRDPASEQLINYKKKHASPSIIQTNWGAPVDDIANVITVGPKGLVPLHDIITVDVIMRHVRSRLPPRLNQGKGAGAFGYFVTTNDITRYSRAVVFKHIGKKTKIAARFTILGSDTGTPDTISRAPRGFSIKFYTEDGIWDLTSVTNQAQFGNNPLKLINFLRSVSRNPVTNLRDFDMVWDYSTLHPESVYDIVHLYSHEGRPDGYRHSNYYGLNTYKMSNSDGTAVYIKFHINTDQGVRSLPPEVAVNLTAIDPDYATRDLYNNIAVRNFPSWTLYIQVMTFEEAERYPYNPFDTLRPWPVAKFPLIEIGRIVLNKNPTNYFADVEQLAFNPAHMIPGIEPSPDKLLQGRLLSYTPSQQYRLGTNFHQLPVNRPFKNGVTNYQSGGHGEIYNQDGAPTYYPNSFGGPENLPSAAMSICYVSGDVARHNVTPADTNDIARDFWLSISEDEKENLVAALAGEIRRTADFIKKRAVAMFMGVSADLGRRIKSAVYARN